jgi:hypothetical protein
MNGQISFVPRSPSRLDHIREGHETRSLCSSFCVPRSRRNSKHKKKTLRRLRRKRFSGMRNYVMLALVVVSGICAKREVNENRAECFCVSMSFGTLSKCAREVAVRAMSMMSFVTDYNKLFGLALGLTDLENEIVSTHRHTFFFSVCGVQPVGESIILMAYTRLCSRSSSKTQ